MKTFTLEYDGSESSLRFAQSIKDIMDIEYDADVEFIIGSNKDRFFLRSNRKEDFTEITKTSNEILKRTLKSFMDFLTDTSEDE